MGKYIHKFDTVSEFEAVYNGQNYIEPWVSYVTENQTVNYNKIADPANGYEYIDLGLPSGTLWAAKNIGANTESDSGTRFAWGEISTKSNFTLNNYKYYNTNTSAYTKYNSTDGKTQLDLEDDAARAIMGGLWRMPTLSDWQELIQYSSHDSPFWFDIDSFDENSAVEFFNRNDQQSTSLIINVNYEYWLADRNQNDTGKALVAFFQEAVGDDMTAQFIASNEDRSRYEGCYIRGVLKP